MTARKDTAVEFDPVVWEVLEGEAARAGVSVRDFVCDAALARVAFGRRARGEGPRDLLAEWAGAVLDDDGRGIEPAVTRQRLIAELARAQSRRRREEAAALRAEARQAIRRAHALGSERGAILDAVITLVGEIVERRGFALAEPVAAGFRVAENGSTGIEISVKLQDQDQVPAARAELVERLGGDSNVDSIDVS
jgi:hypothetical protein